MIVFEEKLKPSPVVVDSTKINLIGSWEENELMELPDGVDSMFNLNFLSSPDGLRFAYIYDYGTQSAVSLDGDIGPLYDRIIFMSFSPDSQHFAYGVQFGASEMIIIDGIPQSAYAWIFPPYFFTPDSQHFVYKARAQAGDFLVFDNQEGNTYDQIYDQFISTDEKSLVYYAKKDNRIYKNVLELK